MPYPSNLELSVTNFGPIARADIDLRPMTVFVGPSNTGKSYLAILIYALHNFFSRHGGERLGSPQRYTDELDSMDAQSMSDERIRSLVDWVEMVVARERGQEYFADLRIQITESIRPMIRQFMEDASKVADRLDREVARCFGVENTGGLIRHKSRGGGRVNLERTVLDSSDPLNSLKYGFTVKKAVSSLVVSIPDKVPLHAEGIDSATLTQLRLAAVRARTILDGRTDFDESIWAVSHLLSRIVGLVEQSILNPLNRVAHYLPAGRTGVMQAHRVAVGNLIARSTLCWDSARRPAASAVRSSGGFPQTSLGTGRTDCPYITPLCL